MYRIYIFVTNQDDKSGSTLQDPGSALTAKSSSSLKVLVTRTPEVLLSLVEHFKVSQTKK